MRERILKAAHSGDPQQVLALMQANSAMPVFSHTQKLGRPRSGKRPIQESGGVEALSILITILETGFVRVGAGTPQKIYRWPWLAREPLRSPKPEQKVDLFRIVTGSDYQDMLARGHYAFYRVGISPSGAWQLFVSRRVARDHHLPAGSGGALSPPRTAGARVDVLGRIERLLEGKAAPAKRHQRARIPAPRPAPPTSSSTTASRGLLPLDLDQHISRPFQPGHVVVSSTRSN